jgi:hypothetical protein
MEKDKRRTKQKQKMKKMKNFYFCFLSLKKIMVSHHPSHLALTLTSGLKAG